MRKFVTTPGDNWGEPERAHIDEFAVEFLSLYICIYILYIVRRAVSHFRLLFCAFLRHSLIHKTIHKLLVLNLARRHQPSSNSKDGDHLWTYLFNDVHEATIQTVHNMPATLASLTQFLCLVSCTPSDVRCCLEPIRLHNLQQTTLLLTLLMHHASWIDLDSLFNCVVHM